MSQFADSPPIPIGATASELATIARLHRAAATIPDETGRSHILSALALIVELIDARTQAAKKPVIEQSPQRFSGRSFELRIAPTPD